MKLEHKRSFALLIAVVILGLMAALLMFDEPGSLSPGRAYAATITRFVATSGADTGDCLSSASPCRTIQFAVDQAGSFNQIAIAQGTYTQTNVRPRNDITTTGSVTQVVYLTKTLTIIGGYTTTNFTTSFPLTQPTTIDAQGKGRGIYIANGVTDALNNLNVTNGNASGMGGGGSLSDDAGGGIYLHASGLSLLRINVISNTADSGGGVYLHSTTSCIVCQSNTIISNTAKFGAGLYLKNSATTTLRNNTVSNNIAQLGAVGGGGGIYLNASAAQIVSNTISANQGGAAGGGIYLDNSAADVLSNTISGNSTFWAGGGLYLASSNATIENNVIVTNSTTATFLGGAGAFVDSASGASINANVIRWNTSAQDGGGLFVESPMTLTNNVVADNTTASFGSGIFVANSTPRFLHTTIARNIGGDGTGVYLSTATAYLTNTILVSHTVGISISVGSTANLNGTLFFNNTYADYCCNGAINPIHEHFGDPRFAPDGYHLTFSSSNAIDLGVNAGVTTDIDGNTRPTGSAPDIGADEFVPIRLYLPLILR